MLNILNILNTIKGILLGYYTANSPTVITILNQYAKESEKTFSDLAKGALDQSLSFAFVTASIKTQKIILKDQLLSVGEVVAADLEHIVNSAIGVFEDALKSIIPATP